MRSPTRAGSRKPQIWFLAALLLNVGLIAWTCGPLLQNPQLDSDDYRYLRHVQLLEGQFWDQFIEAATVENRWDHLWWMDATEQVRFFRPTVVLSYWLDSKLYGDAIVTGLQVTNVLLHLICTLLVLLVLLGWMGPGLPALLGSALFASFWSHGEVLWYIAGRTDTLAAVGYLTGLTLHVWGQGRGSLRWLAVPCYAFALISKELTFALPLLLFLHDLYIERRAATVARLLRREWRLYTTYILVAVFIQLLRAAALSGAESDLVYPYFVTPTRPEFFAHLWAQFRNYSENLLLARATKPFMRPDELGDFSSPAGLAVTLVCLAVFVLALRKDRRFAVLVVLGLLAWLPTSFVYISERYLYLPSVAVAGSLSLLLARLHRQRILYAVGLALAILWIGHQSSQLHRKNTYFALQSLRVPEHIGAQVKRIAPLIDAEDKLLLVNLPGAWLHAQFTEEQLRVQLNAPDLSVRVLSIMPADAAMGRGIEIETAGEYSLEVRSAKVDGARASPLLVAGEDAFSWVKLDAGTSVQRASLDFAVEVLKGDGESCEQLRFVFAEPLSHYKLLRWEAHPERRLPTAERRRRGRVEIIRLE